MTAPVIADHLQHLATLRAAALQAVEPAAAVRRALQHADFEKAERVFVVGAGKAGVAMARATEEILGDRLTEGIVAVPHLPEVGSEKIVFIEGGHPLPTGGSLAAGAMMAELLAHTTERDLVIALISGGGSACLELPPLEITLEDLQATNTALLRCGATTHEMNVVRAQLSRLKGGGLARLAHPAKILGLILSDVVGNSLDVIASGPTYPVQSSRQTALHVIEKYLLRASLPATVIKYLHSSTNGEERRNFSTRPFGLTVENRLIASNRVAGEAAVRAAHTLGFEARLVADDWQGEARIVGERWARLTLENAHRPATAAPLCLVVGGETTVTVRGSGKGGRNQEVALAAAMMIAGTNNVVISTFATDGVDGPTPAAGAVVTGDSLAAAHAFGLSPQKCLQNNDSHLFFTVLDDLIITGPTGTNVNDLMFGLVY